MTDRFCVHRYQAAAVVECAGDLAAAKQLPAELCARLLEELKLDTPAGSAGAASDAGDGKSAAAGGKGEHKGESKGAGSSWAARAGTPAQYTVRVTSLPI